MKFRTEIPVTSPGFSIEYKDTVLFMGSCFTENMGAIFQNLLFNTRINPFGVVYNPLSVKRSLELILKRHLFAISDLQQKDDIWFSWDHHSSFSGTNKDKVLEKINTEICQTSLFLKNADYLFISLGTAWAYFLREDNKLVCNCHKVPAKEFSRKLLDLQTITGNYGNLITSLLSLNPQLKIIFTVSPVRHWKDGAHGNVLSKSVLHLAVDEIIHLYPSSCTYFPSYELLIDDLRDYRYYSSDLLHPSDEAVHYIWEYFCQTYFSQKTLQEINKVKILVRDFNHRFINPDSKASRVFIKKRNEKYLLLKKELPFLNWDFLTDSFNL